MDRQLYEGPAGHYERGRPGRRARQRYDWTPTEISHLPGAVCDYIADIHEAVEDQVKDSRGISYVDDVTWVVEGTDVDDVVNKLERCA